MSAGRLVFTLSSPHELEKALRLLRRGVDAEVRPSVRRHLFALSPGERRRLKSRRARQRAARAAGRRAVRQEEDAARNIEPQSARSARGWQRDGGDYQVAASRLTPAAM